MPLCGIPQAGLIIDAVAGRKHRYNFFLLNFYFLLICESLHDSQVVFVPRGRDRFA